MVGKVNCKHNNRGAWCNNEKVERSLFGFGARVCSDYAKLSYTCPYRLETKRPNIKVHGQKV